MASLIVPQSPGIYKITCTANSKIYVGSSVNLRKRWNEHQKHLRKNQHHNIHLQRAWNKYGAETFVFEILELVMPWSLLDREQYWLDTLRSYDITIGFNIALTTEAIMMGRTHSPETRAKLSLSHKGKKPSDETRAKLSAARIGKRPTAETRLKLSAWQIGRKLSPKHAEHARTIGIGRKHTDEERAKQSAAQMGHTVSPETRRKISEANSGRKRTAGQREKLSESGCKNTYVVTSPDGTEFTVRNLTQFCRENNLDQAHMSAVSLGKERHHKSWKVRRIT